MQEWYRNKDITIMKTVSSAVEAMESILKDENAVNYKIDEAHNIHVFVNDNGDSEDDDKWLEAHLELCEGNQRVGSLVVFETEDFSHKELYDAVLAVVKFYYGEPIHE